MCVCDEPTHYSDSHNTNANPNVTLNVTAVMHWSVRQGPHKHRHRQGAHLCIITPSQLCSDGTKRPGKPDVQLLRCFSADLAELQFPGQAAPVSTWVSGALGSSQGQWEGCNPARPPAQPRGDWSVGLTVGVMSFLSANKMPGKCDSCCSLWWMSRWVHSAFNLRSKCGFYSLTLKSLCNVRKVVLAPWRAARFY